MADADSRFAGRNTSRGCARAAVAVPEVRGAGGVPLDGHDRMGKTRRGGFLRCVSTAKNRIEMSSLLAPFGKPRPPPQIRSPWRA